MALISSTHSITRYHIDGKIEGSINEKLLNGLIKYSIPKIESDYDEIIAGWTPIESPYNPDFKKFSFSFGTYFVFSLRIDKKSIPVKLIQKYMAVETEKKLKNSGRDFISRDEKTELKEHVIDILMHKVPAVPNLYDILWDYEQKNLYLYTTQKAANEFFETIFLKSFKLKPIRLFPYTLIEKRSFFSDTQKDKVLNLTPLKYSR